MIYVLSALAAATVIVALIDAFASILNARTIRAMQRQHARERELLINQLPHVAGRPWAEAPAYTPASVEEAEIRYLTSPEQFTAA